MIKYKRWDSLYTLQACLVPGPGRLSVDHHRARSCACSADVVSCDIRAVLAGLVPGRQEYITRQRQRDLTIFVLPRSPEPLNSSVEIVCPYTTLDCSLPVPYLRHHPFVGDDFRGCCGILADGSGSGALPFDDHIFTLRSIIYHPYLRPY